MNLSDALIRIAADGLVVVVAILGAAVFVKSVRRDVYQTYARAFMAGLSALAVAKIMSLFYQEAARPFAVSGALPKAAYLNNPGFPSDHALLAATVTLVVWAVTGNVRASLWLAGLSVAVGIGRVLALVHTPVDIAGGYAAAAIGVGLWYGWFFKRRDRSSN